MTGGSGPGCHHTAAWTADPPSAGAGGVFWRLWTATTSSNVGDGIDEITAAGAR